MPGVARKILAKLFGRLEAIDGSGDFNFDMTGRVFRCRPSYDVLSEGKSGVFISRRFGGDTRDPVPDQHSGVTVVEVVYDVVAIAPELNGTNEAGDVLEQLKEDIERALEISSDLYLRDDDSGRNLLESALQLVSGDGRLAEVWETTELFAVGVRCRYEHVYGNPDVVTP